MNSSKGIVLFAYDSGYEYVKIANVSAALAKTHLGLPVTLITDVFGALKANMKYIDNVIVCESPASNTRSFRETHDKSVRKIEWKNFNRARVYELTPYEQTLLIDCDFMINSRSLINLFKQNPDFTCHANAYDMTGRGGFAQYKKLSPYSIPMCWATVIYFRKCEFSKQMFEMMLTIKEHYGYYSQLFGFNEYPYRNDFALSIAYHVLTGYGTGRKTRIPYDLMTLSSMTDVIEFKEDCQWIYEFMRDGTLYKSITRGDDIHVMNKDVFTDELIEDILTYGTN